MKVKTVIIIMFHTDYAIMILNDENNKEIAESIGYMPKVGMFNDSDQTILKINNETGKIIGWIPIQEEDINVVKGVVKGKDK